MHGSQALRCPMLFQKASTAAVHSEPLRQSRYKKSSFFSKVKGRSPMSLRLCSRPILKSVQLSSSHATRSMRFNQRAQTKDFFAFLRRHGRYAISLTRHGESQSTLHRALKHDPKVGFADRGQPHQFMPDGMDARREPTTDDVAITATRAPDGPPTESGSARILPADLITAHSYTAL